jgi:hypothetical protein
VWVRFPHRLPHVVPAYVPHVASSPGPALLLVGLLTYAVVLPLSDQWREGAGTVLVEP